MRNSHVIVLWAVLLMMRVPTHAQEANYDESKVGTYILPDALTTNNGQKVANRQQWKKTRRPEILKLFQDNEYGVIPEVNIQTSYRVVEESKGALGGKAIRRQVEITFTGDGKTRQMLVLLYMPQGVKKCPV
ncbi:MAG: acetylxylan esterase, partial [Bacteroidales bacterium]|nr:acetylxylan esterase [Bacteroidales bacterium]